MKSLNLPYQPRLDQLRWFAATLVFLFHFYLEYRGNGGAELNSRWTALVTQGHTGVGLFFTLSGFLFMQIALAQQTIVYRDFVRNRVLRILPLFLTIFLVATSIGRDNFQPQDLLYLFATNLGHAPTSGTVITGAAWTISLEFLFYLVFPFLARFAIERGPRYLLELLLLMGFFKLAAYTVNDNSTLMYFSTFVGRFDQFLIGMLAAMAYLRHQAWLQRHALWLIPCAAALVGFDTAVLQRLAPFGVTPKSSFWIFWSMVESAGWAIFILAWASLRLRLPNVLERVLCHGGKISFSGHGVRPAIPGPTPPSCSPSVMAPPGRWRPSATTPSRNPSCACAAVMALRKVRCPTRFFEEIKIGERLVECRKNLH